MTFFACAKCMRVCFGESAFLCLLWYETNRDCRKSTYLYRSPRFLIRSYHVPAKWHSWLSTRRQTSSLSSIPTRVILKTWRMVLAACPASCSALNVKRKEMVHARCCCHWLVTKEAFFTKVDAWPTAQVNGDGRRRPLLTLWKQYKQRVSRKWAITLYSSCCQLCLCPNVIWIVRLQTTAIAKTSFCRDGPMAFSKSSG